MRRTIVLAAATAIALTALTGCKEDSSGEAVPAPSASAPAATASATAAATAPATAPASAKPSAAGAFDPEKAVANASKEPYAVSARMVTMAGGAETMVSTARQNLNTVYVGRSEMRSTDGSLAMETITTADATYVRNLSGAGGEWAKTPRSTEQPALDYTVYAKLLLAKGPEARKGMETRDGVPTFHLAGYVDLEQIATIDPRTYRSSKAKGITGFDFEQWIDAQGRTRYVEQTVTVRGTKGVNKVTFTDFGPAETFAAPIPG